MAAAWRSVTSRLKVVRGRLLRRAAWAGSRFVGLTPITLAEITGKSEPRRQPRILEGIGVPPHVGGCEHDDYTALMAVFEWIKPRHVLEIGTAFGNLAANMCAVDAAVRVYTVNAPSDDQSGDVVTHVLDRERIGYVYRKCGFAGQVNQVIVDSKKLDVKACIGESLLDFGIVDGCHDVDFVVSDFLKVAEFVRPGGCVLLHDTAPIFEVNGAGGGTTRCFRGHLWQSYLACMVLRFWGYRIRWIEGTWWGYWQRPL